jgi:hypothetical protein
MFPQNSIQMSRLAFQRPIHFLINYPTDAVHLQLALLYAMGGFRLLVCPNYVTIEMHPTVKTHAGICIGDFLCDLHVQSSNQAYAAFVVRASWLSDGALILRCIKVGWKFKFDWPANPLKPPPPYSLLRAREWILYLPRLPTFN